MNDFLQQQRDLAQILLSDPRLFNINVAMRHELLDDTALKRLPDKTLAAEVLVYITPRNGKKGCGIIVERPEFNVQSPNVTGPQGDIVCEFLVLCDTLTNESPTQGTGLTANRVAQTILDILHLHADNGIGTYQARGQAIIAATDFEPLEAYRVRLAVTTKRIQTTRCGPVTASLASSTMTLTCPTSGAEIRYTLDGSFPARTGNPASQIYSAPFAVESGMTLRAVAYADNLNLGPVTNAQIS